MAGGPFTGEEPEQLTELPGQILVGERVDAAAEGGRGHLVGAGGATDAEVDPARMKRFEGAELFGHDQRLVVGQHHAAGTDPDPLRAGREVGDDHGGSRTGDPGHVVVLGHPVAVVAERSAAWTSSVELARASAGSDPSTTGTRSSTESLVSGSQRTASTLEDPLAPGQFTLRLLVFRRVVDVEVLLR